MYIKLPHSIKIEISAQIPCFSFAVTVLVQSQLKGNQKTALVPQKHSNKIRCGSNFFNFISVVVVFNIILRAVH